MKFQPTRSGLMPFDRAAREFIRDLKSDAPIEIEVLNDRDMIEHRKIFAQIGELAKALHRPAETVRAELLFKTGQFAVIGEIFGKTMISINSMSRHHMRDHELHAFWDDAREVIRTDLLPLVTDDLERERLASTILSGRRELAG